MSNKTMFNQILVGAVLLLAVCFVGCVPVSENELQSEPLTKIELDYCLVVAIDLSGSFGNDLASKAYPFFQQIANNYFRGAMGAECRLILGQLSDNKQSVLWEGHPIDLRRDFPDSQAFTAFLQNAIKDKERDKSRIFRGVANVVEYAEGTPHVTENTQLMTIVLSDLHESGSSQAEEKKDSRRMVKAIKRYTDSGGSLGFYFVSPEVRPKWLRAFGKCEINPKRYVIETSLVRRPSIPEFE